MSIARDKFHKRRKTGGKQVIWRKKRKFELGRPAAMTRIGEKRIRSVRVRGGHTKFRALRVDSGNFSWGSQATTRKARILNVRYNSSNNELVRTNTLVKNCIIEIDATPFKAWYDQFYGGKSDAKVSRAVTRKQAARGGNVLLDKDIEHQFSKGRLLACVSSRPGQSGRCDGYILEGAELKFYEHKMQKKKGGASAK